MARAMGKTHMTDFFAEQPERTRRHTQRKVRVVLPSVPGAAPPNGEVDWRDEARALADLQRDADLYSYREPVYVRERTMIKGRGRWGIPVTVLAVYGVPFAKTTRRKR